MAQINGFAAALSGLKAAQTKINVSAQNVANVSTTSKIEDDVVITTPFQPLETAQYSLDTGGTYVEVRESEAEPILLQDPGHVDANADGFVAYPNISLEEQIVDQIQAQHEFNANILTLQTLEKTQGALFDFFV